MQTLSFERFAGTCAILTGTAAFLYAVSFIILRSPLLSGLFLLLQGLLATAALVAVYRRLMNTDGSFALWALLLGVVGAAGSAIHGGFDLANAINPPPDGIPNLPSQIDPRGLLTFGVMSVAFFTIAWLIGRGEQFPRGLSYWSYLLGAVLLVLYLGRLTILDVSNPVILVPAILGGFIVNPAWYIWLGLSLWQPAAMRGPSRST